MNKKEGLFIIICFMVFLLFGTPTDSKSQSSKTPEPVNVVFQTVQFGRSFYDYAFAYEDIARRANSWVKLKTEETPGAMYMAKYYVETIQDQRAGKKPWTIMYGSTNTANFMRNGWGPFAGLKSPDLKVMGTILCRVNFLATFNPNLKTGKDLAGKRVAVESKAAPFNSTLKYLPYFEKGLGVNVDWQFIGIPQGKDALLNNTIDATLATFMVTYSIGSDGITVLVEKAAPDTATMELLASGRKLYFIPIDSKVLMSTYQGEGMMIFQPALMKAGITKGIDVDTSGLAEWLYTKVDGEMPDDIVIELLRIRYEFAESFGNYHSQFQLQPKNPFPTGAPKDIIHPGVYKAAAKFGFKVVE